MISFEQKRLQPKNKHQELKCGGFNMHLKEETKQDASKSLFPPWVTIRCLFTKDKVSDYSQFIIKRVSHSCAKAKLG